MTNLSLTQQMKSDENGRESIRYRWYEVFLFSGPLHDCVFAQLESLAGLVERNGEYSSRNNPKEMIVVVMFV